MIGIFFVNVAFTIICWLVLCFAMPDVGIALEHISTYPVIYILEQSMSTAWVTVELALIVALLLFANTCYITAVSRDLWAFARDGGVPFSPWVSQVRYSCHMRLLSWSLTHTRTDSPKVQGSSQRYLLYSGLFVPAESNLYRF